MIPVFRCEAIMRTIDAIYRLQVLGRAALSFTKADMTGEPDGYAVPLISDLSETICGYVGLKAFATGTEI